MFPNQMEKMGNIFAQFIALNEYPDALAVSSAVHAGTGEIPMGRNRRERIDVTIYQKEGRITMINFHGEIHSEGHTHRCPKWSPKDKPFRFNQETLEKDQFRHGLVNALNTVKIDLGGTGYRLAPLISNARGAANPPSAHPTEKKSKPDWTGKPETVRCENYSGVHQVKFTEPRFIPPPPVASINSERGSLDCAIVRPAIPRRNDSTFHTATTMYGKRERDSTTLDQRVSKRRKTITGNTMECLPLTAHTHGALRTDGLSREGYVKAIPIIGNGLELGGSNLSFKTSGTTSTHESEQGMSKGNNREEEQRGVPLRPDPLPPSPANAPSSSFSSSPSSFSSSSSLYLTNEKKRPGSRMLLTHDDSHTIKGPVHFEYLIATPCDFFHGGGGGLAPHKYV